MRALSRHHRLWSGWFILGRGEMAKDLGAKVELSQVSLKYSGLRPWEIWLSEAQERMVLAVPEVHLARLLELYDHFGVTVDKLGEMTGSGRMEVFLKGT
ncbi:MAG: AIR synthase-related protein [Deinococcales bacterium]